ncbi:MAG: alpha/beta fold hydrolase [Betaproteobacteria bacterium]|nr:alpha/beta fold hydrolase [Betaproteobacteria bacterium]
MIQNVEFFMPGGPNGILLIHGLTGTPNEMRIIGKGLNRAGFTVYGMQLAGHCGNEDDLCQTVWQDWYASVEKAAAFLQTKVERVFVSGLSMGALLALKLAADQPELVKGVGVYGVTFRYDGWSMPGWAKHFFFLLTWLKRLGLFQKTSFIEQPPYGLKDDRIRATVEASMFSGDSTQAGLAGNPFAALAEMQYLAKIVRRQLPDVQTPCLIIHSGHDDIADIDSNARIVERYISGPSKFVVLDDSYHLVTIDRQRREVILETADFFQKIIDAASADTCREHADWPPFKKVA